MQTMDFRVWTEFVATAGVGGVNPFRRNMPSKPSQMAFPFSGRIHLAQGIAAHGARQRAEIARRIGWR